MQKNSIGDRIRQTRKEAGLTQVKFSQELRISRPYLTNIELGNVQPMKPVVRLIATLFEVDENWLIRGKSKQKDSAP